MGDFDILPPAFDGGGWEDISDRLADGKAVDNWSPAKDGLIGLHDSEDRLMACAQVDEKDFERVGYSAWVLAPNGCVERIEAGERISLAEEVLGVTDDNSEVVHLDGDPLNCRRSNLRRVILGGAADDAR